MTSLADRLPHDNRIEAGSVDIPPATFPPTKVPEGTDARKVAADTVATVNKLLAAKDATGLAGLFIEQGVWRDHLALTWGFHSAQGPADIASLLAEAAKAAAAGKGHLLTKVEVDASQPQRAPAVSQLNLSGSSHGIVVYLTVENSIGTGRGLARLVLEGGSWKIFTLYTVLHELKGHEEPLGARRSLGASHGRRRSIKNWREQRDEDAAFAATEPDVLIIGAGQSGLTLAARLKMQGVPALVVDRELRIGDNWRVRYRQLVLHDPVWINHMPYLSFPAFWPVFTPKDKLADFFEAYVALLELNVWTRTEVRSLEYDAAAKRYNVTLERTVVTTDLAAATSTSTTETRVFHPQHVVQATGHSGKKNMPAVPGMDAFGGELLCHSSEFPGATPSSASGSGKPQRAVVVGSCNSGHDIAQDLYENGYDVTMVQRSSTCVVSSKAIVAIGLGALYSEAAQATLPVDDADLLNWGTPAAFHKAQQVQVTERAIEHDTELLLALEKAGFRLDRGIDGSGLFPKYYQRGGGYYIDVGASQLIIEGKIKIKSGQAVAQVTATGLDLADGTHLDADIIVFATGFQNMRTQTRVLFGDALADKTTDVWGYNKEGEFRTMWQRSGQPGFWYMGGNLALARYFSRLLALQIKGQQLGLMPYEV